MHHLARSLAPLAPASPGLASYRHLPVLAGPSWVARQADLPSTLVTGQPRAPASFCTLLCILLYVRARTQGGAATCSCPARCKIGGGETLAWDDDLLMAEW